MLNKIIKKFLGIENEVQRNIVIKTAEPRIFVEKIGPCKNYDYECNLYRYNIRINYSDNSFEAFETIAVNEDVGFENAASKSISFKSNYEAFYKRNIAHLDSTRGSINVYEYEDGSRITISS